MCGIAGRLVFGEPPGAAAATQVVARMAPHIAHRGPDAAGAWADAAGRIAFGHSRLSIIDLDPRSTQPMRTPDERLTITYNGEIYNYQELRASASLANYPWKTTSDTEVILALYRGYGSRRAADYLDTLRGMFALAIWDRDDETLLLARDPVGKKPVYYARNSRQLIFASTLRALLATGDVARDIDDTALGLYLSLGYVPAPFTIFRGVRKLEAGHYLVAGADGRVDGGCYWAPAFEPKTNLGDQDLQAQILEKLEDATRHRMLADVPLGAFLSGGVDSSAVVAMMSRSSSRPVKTFSVGFDGAPGDEAPYAARVAQHLGCEHHALRVALAPQHLPAILTEFEEPFADAAAIPTYFMSKAAREHVTVVLNGDGGDEDFAGYTLRHRSYAWAEALRPPAPARQVCLGLSRLLPNRPSESSLPSRIRKSLRIVSQAEWRRNVALMEVFGDDDAIAMPGDTAEAAFFEKHWQAASRFDGLDRELYFSFALHLPEQLLVKVDRAAMAWALEARSPLLDRDFVEFCAGIPVSRKLTARDDKVIFRRALAGLVPPDILQRPKQGFLPPLGEWLRHDLRPLIEGTLLAKDAFVARQFDRGAVNALIQQHLDGRRDHQRQLYALLALEVWERLFVRQEVWS